MYDICVLDKNIQRNYTDTRTSTKYRKKKILPLTNAHTIDFQPK